ncbi:MAG: ferredoxin [Candidatus Aenigmatarchaeota archaeon]
MVKIRISVNEKCIGCGACIAIAPEIFEFDEDGFSKPKITETEDEKLIRKAREAEEKCPVKAINIEKID